MAVIQAKSSEGYAEQFLQDGEYTGKIVCSLYELPIRIEVIIPDPDRGREFLTYTGRE